MRCLSCGLMVADTSEYLPILTCPRCGQPMGQRPDLSGNYPSLRPISGSPGQPHFTLPTLPAIDAQSVRRKSRRRADAHGDLHREPPYPALAPQSSKRTPLIAAVLSVAVVLALLLGAGIVWRGNAKVGQGGSQLATVPPHAAHSADPTPSATRLPGTVLYRSSLQGTAGGWVNDSHCSYGDDGYHITGAYLCYAPVTQQSNVDITVTAKQLSGTYSLLYGIVIRASGKGNSYLFGIDGNGKWTFAKLSDNQSQYLIPPTSNAAIRRLLNQPNTLEVTAIGSNFKFYVNGVQVGQANDTSYSVGLIGLTSEGGVEITYANISVARPAAH